MMKNIYISTVLALSFLFTLFTNTTLFAQEHKKIVRVGYTESDSVVNDITLFGYEGYGYEILKKIEEKSNFKFEFIRIDGNRFEALESGQVDIIGFFFHTPERAKKYLYLETPLTTIQTALVAPTRQNRIYDNPKLIDGKTVATYEENLANEFLKKYVAENNISINYVIGDFHNYKKLEADFYLVYSSSSGLTNYNNVMNFEKRYGYLISSLDNKEMMDKLNTLALEVVTTEGNFFELLGEKYMGKAFHTFHRSLKEDELKVLRKKTLKVAYNEIARPLTYTNSDGKADGALIDIMNKLTDIYEFEVEYHPYSHLNPVPVLEKCDIALSVAGDMDYYKKHFTPSQKFMKLPIVAVAPRKKIIGKFDSESIRKSLPKIGTLNYLYVNFDHYLANAKENSFVFFENFYKLIEAYENNAIDMLIMTNLSSPYVSAYLSNENSFTFKADFDLGIRMSFANAIADEYIPLFNIMLDNISMREYDEILIQNQAIYFYEQTFTDMLLKNWYYLVILAFVLLSLLLYISLRIQRKRKNEIKNAYETDELTFFMTLYIFMDQATKKVRNAPSHTYEFITFDIDMFKNINIHFGEDKGTQVIVNIAKALKEAFKGLDVLLCRKTSDSFLIFKPLNKGNTIENIFSIFILPSIKKVLGEDYNISMSFGKVTIDDTSEPLSSFLGKAENARMQGKNVHKTTFITFDEAMKKSYENKLNVTYRMKEALENHEFTVVYQPKINFNSLKVDGAEALVRWSPKEGRTIFPDQFIPVFEQNGFILSLDLYVLDEVCKFIVQNDKKINVPRISVNLSAHSVLADDLIERTSEIFDVHGISPEKIEFEITESAVERDPKLFLQRIQELKKHGFIVSIDDFGAGVSSLNRLSAIEAHVLKLDKTFFDLEGTEEKKKVVVSNVIRMAKDLNMSVVAEGVETKEQALWLREIKSDYAQGYYFAKPMNESDFRELLESKKIFTLD